LSMIQANRVACGSQQRVSRYLYFKSGLMMACFTAAKCDCSSQRAQSNAGEAT
jgi:hypothetical protein